MTTVSEAARSPADQPWIETKEGSLFFVNSLLVAPGLIVLVPLVLRAVLDAIGGPAAPSPSPVLDTIPTLAAYVVPFAAWILVIPVWLVVRNLRISARKSVRGALVFFLLVHLGYLGYGVWWWLSGGGGRGV